MKACELPSNFNRHYGKAMHPSDLGWTTVFRLTHTLRKRLIHRGNLGIYLVLLPLLLLLLSCGQLTPTSTDMYLEPKREEVTSMLPTTSTVQCDAPDLIVCKDIGVAFWDDGRLIYYPDSLVLRAGLQGSAAQVYLEGEHGTYTIIFTENGEVWLLYKEGFFLPNLQD